jgi:hypothetical protein
MGSKGLFIFKCECQKQKNNLTRSQQFKLLQVNLRLFALPCKLNWRKLKQKIANILNNTCIPFYMEIDREYKEKDEE